MSTIDNMRDLAGWLGTDQPADFNRRLYKDTECGASISLYFADRLPLHHRAPGWEELTLDTPIIGFTIQTIVEGSDAEVNSELFRLPVDVARVDQWVEEMEIDAANLWHEANDEI